MNHVTGGESHLTHDLNVNIGGSINISGNMNDSTLARFADKLGESISKNVKKEIVKEVETGGRLRVAVQSASKKGIH